MADKPKSIVILTGAGVSAESGIATFRGIDGLWEGHRIEEVASPEGFAANPAMVHRFYDQRRSALQKVDPNPAHDALAKLDREWKQDLLLVTQNIDNLHERAGSERILHMHGELLSALCMACDKRSEITGDLLEEPPCPHCQCPGALRPDIVWFGEMPYHMKVIEKALKSCDMFVSIGTSGAVYPAAGFVQVAKHNGAQTLEINLEPSAGNHHFDEALTGKAGEIVPDWVDSLLGNS